jgi:RNA polymerase sigma-70 factor (ECF subfamily)
LNDRRIGYPAARFLFSLRSGRSVRPEHDTDVDLVRRLAEGDKTALAALVKRHQRRVFDIAYRVCGDQALAEDVTQETFLRVWRAAPRYQPQAKFTTWVYRIVVNLCRDAFKTRRPTAAARPGAFADGSIPTCDPLEADDNAQRVREAVADLPERQRLALVLHRFTEMPLSDIVDATGWSHKAVESLLVRAYNSLRAALKDLGDP